LNSFQKKSEVAIGFVGLLFCDWCPHAPVRMAAV